MTPHHPSPAGAPAGNAVPRQPVPRSQGMPADGEQYVRQQFQSLSPDDQAYLLERIDEKLGMLLAHVLPDNLLPAIEDGIRSQPRKSPPSPGAGMLGKIAAG